MTGVPHVRAYGRTLPSILGLALIGLVSAACGSTLTEPEHLLELDGVSSVHTADPVTADDCRDGGWEALGFKNQGQCVRFVKNGNDSREHPDDGEPPIGF